MTVDARRAQKLAHALTQCGRSVSIRPDLPSKDLTELLHAWAGADAGALAELLPLVYADLRRRAAAHMRGNGGTTR